MTFSHLFRRLLLVLVPTALSVTLLAVVASADQPADKDSPRDRQEQAERLGDALPNAEKADKAAATEEAPAPVATVTPEAKQVINLVDAAYAKLKSLELAGTFSGNIEAAGEQVKESKKFTASFSAPNKFRHAMESDILVGSTGEKAYAYLEDRNLFTQGEAPKDKAELERLPEPLPQVLQMQNPSLMFALVKSAAAEMGETFSEIKKVQDTKLGGAAFHTLQATLPNRTVVTMLFHPDTHLLRQARADISEMLKERGTRDVKSAVLTVDYTKVEADAALKDGQFTWAPPETARDLAEVAAAEAAQAGPGGGSPASELEGKPAPGFSLQDMEGKKVALADLKGKVVVLDLWATWCPPCRASLPHLDKLYEATKDKDVKVYALNLQEDKSDVEQFIKTTGLKTPVLLDSDGAVAQAYRADSIPQTVVIGKDGKVKKVLVGFSGEQSANDLKDAVEKALKG